MFHKPPSWLQTAVETDSYVRRVFLVLEEREVKRDAARNSTRHRQDNQSMGHTYRRPVDKKHASHYSIAVATHPNNESSNRYVNVEPYDRSRVIVQPSSHGQSDTLPSSDHSAGLDIHGRYLNASWVLEKYGQKWWIANQAPLLHTAHAFLSVILQPITQPQLSGTDVTPSMHIISMTSRVRTVVQLTQNIEDGRRKADSYFPAEVGRAVVVRAESGCNGAPLSVKLLQKSTHPDTNSVESIVSITPLDSSNMPHESKAVIFRHLLYLKWPDHGVPEPEDTDSLLAFVYQVHRLNKDLSLCPSSQLTNTRPGRVPEFDPDPPIMVGCSAGIGRTGSFIVLSSLLRKFGFLDPPTYPSPSSVLKPSPLGPIPDGLSNDLVAQEVDSLREQRPGMVQRPEQISLIYQVLMDAFTSQACR